MKKLATVLLIALTGTGAASVATAQDYVVFTTVEYCELERTKKSRLDDNYLRAYAKRLGQKPSNRLCRTIRDEKFANSVQIKTSKWSDVYNESHKTLSQNVLNETVKAN